MSREALRITHVIRAKPPGELGGADLHVADLAERQLSKGHRVLVVCLGSAEVARVLRERSVPCAEQANLSMLRWACFLVTELRRRPPDVLHTHGYRADIISLLVRYALMAGGRWTTVMTVHGFIRTTLGTRALTWVNEHALRLADVVIATSPAEANRLGTLLHRPVQYVPNGIFPVRQVTRQVARARLGIATSRCVAFTGRLSPEKRPDLFVSMAELLTERDSETTFAFIGSGPLAEPLARRLPPRLRGRVVFAGLHPDAASLLSGIDVLVCPSDTEGTPRVIIEAMLAGVPVVGTRVGGVPDLIINRQTGLLVEPGSPGALADAVRALLDRPELAQAIAARARTAAQFLTSDQMEEQTAQAYVSGALSPLLETKAS